ncbi:PREDICTED: growth arrest and DNA damage-inducible proteins-interacting protein 1 [Dinoponera quadriceps]|uniref:Large ribosomal subunit protein mL64 n=1 Tax=Dinoponera quadriceps TaxID=609295 RepID=A0A6P3WW18_DINQU|nr:PREDICTED: growth arrest and DNA damage-inducible proteins-interacting protein 1 [Dinoponera quadriceps]
MRLSQIYNIVHRNVGFQSVYARRLFASTNTAESKDEVVDITSADEKPIFSEPDNEEYHAEIARKRNKSRLSPEHRNILMGERPYDGPKEWYHNTVKYKKRMLGRYGLKADEPAGFVWPTLEEIKDAQEYERVAFPLSLQERWDKLEDARRQKAEFIKKREAEILVKLAKMDQWTAELNAKMEKKKADMEAARLRKERLVAEIRRHFGFNISPHDNRFKEMLEQKEKEEKKKKKEAKKKAKLDRLTLMVHAKVKSEANPEETAAGGKDQDSKKSTE